MRCAEAVRFLLSRPGRPREALPGAEGEDGRSRGASLPRGWRTIVPLALRASPDDALRGLGWVAKGKRVRGWNLVYRAASLHPAYYRRWVARAEERIIRDFEPGHPPIARPVSVGCLILELGAGDARGTLRSARASLGSAVPVWTVGTAPGTNGATPIPADTSLAQALAGLGPEINWLLPLCAGDTLSPALGAMLARMGPDPRAAPVVYWDEDRMHDGQRADPWVKPDWDPLLLGDGEGLLGAGLIATDALRAAAAGSASAADRAGLIDAVGRVLAATDAVPLHLPLILTHRHDGAVVASAPDPVRHASFLPAPPTWPDVAIIIPVRDRADLLAACMAGLRGLVYPGRTTITIVDNDSVEPETHALLAWLRREDAVDVLPFGGAFNFAAMMNHAARNTSAEVLCLLNNDVEARDGRWLEAMVRHAVEEKVGAVGARLLYPDGTVQHAGVAIGVGGAAGHVGKGVHPQDPRFRHWHDRTRVVSAVTAACMVMERAKFWRVGGMDAEAFPVDFNDVDLCLKLQGHGLHNVLAVEATLVHHESQSRGTMRAPVSAARFARELATLRARWGTVTRQDAHYSPLFRREAEQCILTF